MIDLNLKFEMKEFSSRDFIDTMINYLDYVFYNMGEPDISFIVFVDVLGPDTEDTPWENCTFNSKNIVPFLQDVSHAAAAHIDPEDTTLHSDLFFSLLNVLSINQVIRI